MFSKYSSTGKADISRSKKYSGRVLTPKRKLKDEQIFVSKQRLEEFC